jgi:hypothetical protein
MHRRRHIAARLGRNQCDASREDEDPTDLCRQRNKASLDPPRVFRLPHLGRLVEDAAAWGAARAAKGRMRGDKVPAVGALYDHAITRTARQWARESPHCSGAAAMHPGAYKPDYSTVLLVWRYRIFGRSCRGIHHFIKAIKTDITQRRRTTTSDDFATVFCRYDATLVGRTNAGASDEI